MQVRLLNNKIILKIRNEKKLFSTEEQTRVCISLLDQNLKKSRKCTSDRFHTKYAAQIFEERK